MTDADIDKCRWPHLGTDCKFALPYVVILSLTLGLTLMLASYLWQYIKMLRTARIVQAMERRRRKWNELQAIPANLAPEKITWELEAVQSRRTPLEVFLLWIVAFAVVRIVSVAYLLLPITFSSLVTELVFHAPQCFYIGGATAYLLSSIQDGEGPARCMRSTRPALLMLPFVVLLAPAGFIGYYHDRNEHAMEGISEGVLWAIYALFGLILSTSYTAICWNRSTQLLQQASQRKWRDIMTGTRSCKNGYRKLEKIAAIIKRRGVAAVLFALIFGSLCALMIFLTENEPRLEIIRAIVDTAILGLLPPLFIMVLLALAYVRRLWKKNVPTLECDSVSTSGSTTPGRYNDEQQAVTPRTMVEDTVKVPQKSAMFLESGCGGRRQDQTGGFLDDLEKSMTNGSGVSDERRHAW